MKYIYKILVLLALHLFFNITNVLAREIDDISKSTELISKVQDSSNFVNTTNLSLKELQSIMDSANKLTNSETAKSIYYSNLVLKSAELQNYNELKIDAFLNLGWAYLRIDSFDVSIQNFRQAEVLSEIMNDTVSYVKSLRGRAYVYRQLGQVTLAVDVLKRILIVKDAIQNSRLLISVLTNLSDRYKDLADYTNALNFALQSLQLSEKLGHNNDIYNNYITTANIYRHLRDYDHALQYSDKANHLASNDSTITNLNRLQNQYGLIYLGMELHQTALNYFQLAYNSNKMNNYIAGMGRELNNMSGALKELGNLKKSQEYLFESLKFTKEAFEVRYIGDTYNQIASNFIELKEYDLARKYIDSAMMYDGQMRLRDRILTNYLTYVDLYKAIGNSRKALDYYKKYITLKDSIYSEKNQGKIAEMQTLYELDKKESENALLRKNNEIQHLKIINQTRERNLFFFIIGLGIVVIGVVYSRYRQKMKANILLQEKNEIINLQKEQLKEAVATKDKFFSIIAHDLKSPFNTILGFTGILERDYENHTDEQRKKFIGLLSKSSQTAFLLLENLLIWARSQRGFIKINKEELNLKELVDVALSTHIGSATNKNIIIQNNIPALQHVYTDCETMKIVIGNLINNAIKFTHWGGEIRLSSEVLDKRVKIKIQDTGIGMSNEVTEKLFRIEESFSTKGTGNEEGSGLGLIICKEFVEKNDGEIKVESESGIGSTFIISLPEKKTDNDNL